MGPVSAHFLCGVAGSTACTQALVLHPPELSNPKTGQNCRDCLPPSCPRVQLEVICSAYSRSGTFGVDALRNLGKARWELREAGVGLVSRSCKEFKDLVLRACPGARPHQLDLKSTSCPDLGVQGGWDRFWGGYLTPHPEFH